MKLAINWPSYYYKYYTQTFESSYKDEEAIK